jgi:RNA polymerase sigma factor (sigma-70 family)
MRASPTEELPQAAITRQRQAWENPGTGFGQDADVRGTPADVPTDGAVLAGSLEDSESFELIFLRHFGLVYGYLARRVGRDLASDLASDTFAVAFTRRGTFDPSHASARPWLFGIATNLLRNHRRAELRQLRAYARTGIDPLVHDATIEADDRLDAERLGPALARGLSALRDDDREVLLLSAWASLTYEEIGRALDIPSGTVRSRLARARRVLREHIDLREQVLNTAAERGEG